MRIVRTHGTAVLMMAMVIGCKDLTQTLPAGVQDPDEWKTEAGALSLYRGALLSSVQGFTQYMASSGMLTDELTDYINTNPNYDGKTTRADRRVLNPSKTPNEGKTAYTALQRIRNHTRMAITALASYIGDSSTVMQAELYALQGLSVVMLAEGYCSGVPLSTVDFDQDYTYQPGLSTDVLLSHAMALFDTAITAAKDSTRIVFLAKLGKARAALFLNDVTQAAELVADIPNTYRYSMAIPERNDGGFIQGFYNTYGVVPDKEGLNGLPYRSSKDPRSNSYALMKSPWSTDSLYVPTRFKNSPVYLTIADHIEARLIEAEHDLRTTGTNWLTTLNTLRTNGTFTVTSSGSTSDTLWNPGTGQITGLAPLTDPADTIADPDSAEEARITLLFTERAYWLFLTGHRQGDVRRLIRPPFRRSAETLYPTGLYGPYGALTGLDYGTATFFPVPETERLLNPQYSGCISYDA